ncbi:hypothetical protein [Evansella clarkii]|uniref:hypothetical protein n=1 Tax=Evansella clarkii TaxID=79879 RepID=UPI000995F1F2|nr:hypothetical protein [Evansella clarkii]
MFNPFKMRAKSRNFTYTQIAKYLDQNKVPEPLIKACVRFLESQAQENGEGFVGPKTRESLIARVWYLTEAELEAVYHKAPMAIRHYVSRVTLQPDMPAFNQLIRPVEKYSFQAQQAYLFLSESSQRVVYGMKYEPDYIWKMVQLYDEEELHQNATKY